MKLRTQQKVEIVIYSAIVGLVGLAVGYYWAAATAAERAINGQ